MSEKKYLFSNEDNILKINKVISVLSVPNASLSSFEAQRNINLCSILELITSIGYEWDLLCQINIDLIGRLFANYFTKIQSKEEIDDLYGYCFRFALEYHLSCLETLIDVQSFIDYGLVEADSFGNSAKRSIDYASRATSIFIAKDLFNNKSMNLLKDFDEIAAKAERLKKGWDTEIVDKETKVENLKSALDEYKNAFNFVGLFKGFDDLSVVKVSEKKRIFWCLIAIGVAIIVPLIGQFVSFYLFPDLLGLYKNNYYIPLIPVLSFVIILLYFFKIILMNYKSVQSQLLQIELRKTLCQFIQSYGDYSQGIKAKDANALEKFENIIFSGIVADDGKIPSTFDGMDQLVNVIKSIKN
ncbi:hypothetical protein SAMN05660337_1986 [Maridesulfovibrio ferrireducens]|uniref:Uncharacterized protein n=1 Tax=Maridesulfovibrio ferrireducens TaxID=246191 RepID=A0A1G9H2Y4_9BACT|nr:hypothetical protein [Maridesulfovibrio ferrireducens]SDL07308.1 hypothetical protein SAMN05660337_1986 [Maridesulfovibrio ferrireducens]